jgi:predicted transcriptional regulator YdeE
MKAELVRLGPLLLGGVDFYGDPFTRKGGWDSDNEIGNTWRRFSEFISENSERTYSAGKNRFYEAHIYGGATAQKGYFEVFIGEEVTTAELPFSFGTKFFGATDYLKVTLTGQEITGDWWKTLETEILPAHDVRSNREYILQAYDERFLGMDRIGESEIDVYVPVQKAYV